MHVFREASSSTMDQSIRSPTTVLEACRAGTDEQEQEAQFGTDTLGQLEGVSFSGLEASASVLA